MKKCKIITYLAKEIRRTRALIEVYEESWPGLRAKVGRQEIAVLRRILAVAIKGKM